MGPSSPLLEVLDLVAIEPTGTDRFVCSPRVSNRGRIGGSELLTAGLLASVSSTRSGLAPAGVQAMFLRSGRADLPVELAVTHLQDSRTSAVRSVVASQDGTMLMTATYRFVLSRPSVDWQPEFVFEVGPDDGVESLAAVATMDALQGFDVRAAVHPADGRPVIHPYWVKTKAPLPDDPLLHAALVLYLTDIGTTGSARAPGTRLRDRLGAVSLDHTFWWHRPVRMDQWVRVNAASLSESGGRAKARGEVVSVDGVLVASFAQEAFVPEPRPTA